MNAAPMAAAANQNDLPYSRMLGAFLIVAGSGGAMGWLMGVACGWAFFG